MSYIASNTPPKTNMCILTKIEGSSLELNNNYIFIPAWELDKEENTITLRYEEESSENEDPLIVTKTFSWHQEDIKASAESDYISSRHMTRAYYDTAQNKWIHYYTNDPNAPSLNETVQNKFVRESTIFLPLKGGFSYYCPISYEYKGTKSSGSKTDKFIKNGDLYLIASDQPVLMQTYLTTTNSYNDCKNWNLEQWQKNHRRIDEMVLSFTPETCHTLQYYSPDTSKLREKTCYVIVARYADGHTQMSEVMQK